MFEQIQGYIEPTAEVRYAFDEQALKRQWDEACADEGDAFERKVAVLQAALKQWPMVLSSNPGQRAQGKMVYSPEMRRFVRDVLGMPDDQRRGSMNDYALRLLRKGVAGCRARIKILTARTSVARKLRRAVIEVTTKYRLGADPTECMETLDNYYKELTDVKA